MIFRFCYAVYLQLLNQHHQVIPTLVTRPFFARSKGGVWERDYIGPSAFLLYYNTSPHTKI